MANPFAHYSMESLAERLCQRIERGDFHKAVIGSTNSGYCVFSAQRLDEGRVRIKLACTPNIPGQGPTRSPFPREHLPTILGAVGAYDPEIYTDPADDSILYVEWRPVRQARFGFTP